MTINRPEGGLKRVGRIIHHVQWQHQPFSQGRQHHGDLLGGGFQPVQGRVMSSSERGAAGLTAKGLDPLDIAMFAIPDKGVDVSFGDTEV